VMLMKYNRFK